MAVMVHGCSAPGWCFVYHFKGLWILTVGLSSDPHHQVSYHRSQTRTGNTDLFGQGAIIDQRRLCDGSDGGWMDPRPVNV